jgi:HlyD family secretion protein
LLPKTTIGLAESVVRQKKGVSIFITQLSAILVATLILLVVLPSCKPRSVPVKAKRRNITQAIYASGKVTPVGYYRVSATVPGFLERLFVRVGDTVEAGQALFSVKNETGGYAVTQTENTLSLARQNAGRNGPLLRAAGDEVASARARLQLDSVAYVRYGGLAQAGAGTRQALDQAKTAFTTSKLGYERAIANYDAARLRLNTEASNAQAAFNAQKTNLNSYTVSSVMRGRVYDQVPKPGEYVGPASIVMELGRADAFEVELSIDEADMNLVRAGQDIFFGSDAFGQKLAKGKILEVYPKIGQTTKSIKAIASIALPQGLSLFAGATLEANIVYQTRANALVLPKAYVLSDSVTVRERGKYRKIRVSTGLYDTEFVEIRSGISEATEVYKPVF